MAKPQIPESAVLETNATLKDHYEALIAIPCCNEYSTLPQVIESLERNGSLTEETLVVINVNNRLSADSQENQQTIQWLQDHKTSLQLAWLNNCQMPHSYPEKFGVGLARHQAVNAGLVYIADTAPVISLDADSPVNETYLEEIFKACQSPGFLAGHVNFQHQHQGTQEEIHAIRLYDQHLHLHRQRLQDAGSPHCWYAIGSTIVCTAKAYKKAGGYNVRKMAGEDFYLLQQLSKTGCHINMIEKAFVYPSNRPSDRVPFGTGKAVSDILDTGTWHTYHSQCYEELKVLLESVKEHLDDDANEILKDVSQNVKDYLAGRKFTETWTKLQQNSRDAQMLHQRFHEWLDAFQTLKLIHHLTESSYPKEELSL
jgi:hypothetical protein